MSAPMPAIRLHAVGDLRLESLDRPRPKAGEVLVRVAWCGVCGSDLPRMFVKGAHRHPLVCGHEFAGVVAEVGPQVESCRPGDRVAVFPLVWCGRCPACELGEYARCADYDYLGSRRDGGFAEYVTAPARNLIPVPATVPLAAAALVEPAAVALHALRRAGGVGPGQSVAVFGAGPIGLLAAQWARLYGAAVLLFDLDPRKLELARQLGLTSAYDPREAAPETVCRQATGGRGVHLAIEAVGAPVTLVQALSAARSGGRVVLLGNPSADATLPSALLSQILRGELSIYGTWNSVYRPAAEDDDWRTALEAMADGRLQTEPLITRREPLAAGIPLLRALSERREWAVKVLLGGGEN